MSRSKHQTYRKVFAGKSKSEVDAMFALLEKRALKRQAKADRKSD